MGNLGFLRISSVIILFHSPTRSLGQSVPVGGAYIGCGYDVLFGNPDGASFLNGGLDPGLKPSKFILKKTFKNRDYCPLEGTCVELGGTYGEEVCSLQADMQQYKQDYSSLWSYDNQGNILLASFGGTMSYSSQEAKNLVEVQEKVILTKRKVSIAGEVSYNIRQNRQLDREFVEALCELPEEYSIPPYKTFLSEWGTHVLIAAKLGWRESVREEYSKEAVINRLQRNQSGILSSKGGALGFLSSSLTGSISTAVINDLRTDSASTRRWTSATGSPLQPAPISLTLKGVENFMVYENFNNSRICQMLQTNTSVVKLRERIKRALADYPSASGAKLSQPLMRTMNITWPRGTYALLAANAGCPDGPWSTGERLHDTDDFRPNNGWSDDFNLRTTSDLWKNNLRLKFCVKQMEFDENALDFPQGSYCILKKGSCAPGFQIGEVFIDDADYFNKNEQSGVLPDGTFDKDTKYIFCCRDDGAVKRPIFLPTDKPFFLSPIGPACQIVATMTAELHWLRIDDKGKSKVTGKAPYLVFGKKNNPTLYFCYYKPENKE